MKIIAVMNQKGGVGKTMTSAAIAYILGEEMKNRVLIADADQQGNVSMLYGVYDPEGLGMPELLEAHQAAGGAYSTKELIQQTTYSNIQIIPANGYLMRTNAELLLVEREDQILRFSAAMNEVRTEYDYCIVDCGLLLDMTVMNVLAAADLVIVPAKIGGFEIGAINNMVEQLETFRDFNVAAGQNCKRGIRKVMPLEKMILVEYADMKEEIKDLRKRIQKLESEIGRLENSIVTDSVSCGKKGKKSLGTVKISGVPNGLISRKRTTLAARRALLVEREAKLLELMNEAEEYINSIEKSELRMMFEFYYIDDLTWCQVAQRMNHAFPKRRIKYTEDNCRMRHNRFLDENEKDLKKI